MPPKGFKPAKRESVPLMIGLSGPSGSGKTFSAMQLADGLTGSDPFYVVDSESRRSLRYAGRFEFEDAHVSAPFAPQRYIDIVGKAVDRGFGCVLCDTISPVWDAEGGVRDMAEKAGGNWIKPKAEHHRFIRCLLQCGAHVICTIREREKGEFQPHPNKVGKKVWVELGSTPITERSTLYEFDLRLQLQEERPGVINLKGSHKVLEDNRPIFLHDSLIDREHGEKLARWCAGESTDAPDIELWKQGRQAAAHGMATLRAFAKGLTPEQRVALRPIGPQLNDAGRRADYNKEF